MGNKKYVYLVRQTQPTNYYEEKAIAVFDDQKQAKNLARALNKKYGHGCVFNEKWDLVELGNCENLHYYDIDCQEINPDPQKYLGI